MRLIRNMVDVLRKRWRIFWITDTWVGIQKRKCLTLLQRRYRFQDWNLSPINERPYAREIVRFMQRYGKENKIRTIVEIGCGMGSIIGNIENCRTRIGIDADSKSISVARKLHPFVKFYKGSFDSVSVGKIDCLIMVNFIHQISEDILADRVQALLKKSQVELVVFDTFENNQGTEYLYSHRGEYLLQGKYRLLRRSRGFSAAHGARRYIEYWEKD